MASQAITKPEPMNATPHHSKVKVSLAFGNSVFVAGSYISGKMEMECRADKGLGIKVMMVELFAIQELTSRDHSATSTFVHSRRLFQGPGLPPSNAVQAHPLPGDPILPPHYHQARRGLSTFLFRFPLPASSPSALSFGSGLASVRYEIRASVEVVWKGENRLVTDKCEVDVVEAFEENFERQDPEGVVVAENGKIWVQGRVVGGVIVAGESACVELQVKNHSSKKNTGLSVTLSRSLLLPGGTSSSPTPLPPSLQISDTLTTVPFRGPEYIIPPGAEGVASLVFDVPRNARGVKGGTLDGDETQVRTTDSLFEVRCVLGVKIAMPVGSKDIQLDLPVTVVHPAALPVLPPPQPQHYQESPHVPYPYSYANAFPAADPYAAYPSLPLSPAPTPFVDLTQNQVWLPPPGLQPYQYFSPPIQGQQQYYFPPPPAVTPVYNAPPHRPASASGHIHPMSTGLPGAISPVPFPIPGSHQQQHQQYLLPPLPAQVSVGSTQQDADGGDLVVVEGEEGKGTRASRISQNLHSSGRHRSVSPVGRRFPVPAGQAQPPSSSTAAAASSRNLPVPPKGMSIAIPPADVNSKQGWMHSPRPLLSPKRSFTNNSLPKSERVEELERMADEVVKQSVDLSGDLPKTDISSSPDPSMAGPRPPLPDESVTLEAANVNKTLPGPPVPTRNGALTSGVARTRVDTYFTAVPAGDGGARRGDLTPTGLDDVPPERAPPTPALTATNLKHRDLLGVREQGESGLDALERRLLAEVGTRKIDERGRPDVREVLARTVKPIDIPSKKTEPPLNDSAISSLTLAGGEEEEQMSFHRRVGADDEKGPGRPRKRSEGRSEGRTERGGKQGDKDKDKDKDKERRNGKKEKERGKDKGGSGGKDKGGSGGKDKGGSGRKDKDGAKGRVAAWLGGLVDPEIPDPPLEEPESAGEVITIVEKKESEQVEETKPSNSSASPNPRSSGFVPIGTLKTDRETFLPVNRKQAPAEMLSSSPFSSAKRVQDIWSSTSPAPVPALRDNKVAVFPKISPSPWTAQSLKTDRAFSPPSTSAATGGEGNGKGPWEAVKSPAVSKPEAVGQRTRIVQPSPRLPPRKIDPEVKYDIRSARGGRGGKVTAVAAIWGSGATGPNGSTAKKDARLGKPTTTLPPPRATPVKSPLTSPPSSSSSAPTTTRPAPAGIKSPSVPAVVSSSFARPTLSSTASLARPSPANTANNKPSPVKVPSTIAETSSAVGGGSKVPPGPAAKPVGAGDLAFGQARLRDLIKKYQGQAKG